MEVIFFASASANAKNPFSGYASEGVLFLIRAQNHANEIVSA